MTVRRAVETDAEGLSRLAAVTFPLACTPQTSADFLATHIATRLDPESFRRHLADPDCVVLLADGGAGADPVGYTMLLAGEPTDPDVAGAIRFRPTISLERCYVHPDHHGGGVAGRLMTATLRGGPPVGCAGHLAGRQRGERAGQRVLRTSRVRADRHEAFPHRRRVGGRPRPRARAVATLVKCSAGRHDGGHQDAIASSAEVDPVLCESLFLQRLEQEVRAHHAAADLFTHLDRSPPILVDHCVRAVGCSSSDVPRPPLAVRREPSRVARGTPRASRATARTRTRVCASTVQRRSCPPTGPPRPTPARRPHLPASAGRARMHHPRPHCARPRETLGAPGAASPGGCPPSTRCARKPRSQVDLTHDPGHRIARHPDPVAVGLQPDASLAADHAPLP